MLDGEFAMSEFWDLEVLVFGIRLGLLMVSILWFVTVGGLAALIRRAHIHSSRVFAGSGSICGYTTGPTFTIAGGGSVGVLQGLIFDVWI